MENKKSPIVTIYIGISGSGKSTAAKNEVEKNPNTVIVSRDNFRFGLQNKGLCSNKIEELINDLMDVTITKSLNKKLDVIIDNTNLKPEYINHFIELCNTKADIQFRIFDVGINKAKEWNKQRATEKIVPENVIDRQYKQYLSLLDSFDFSYRKKKEEYGYEEYLSLNYLKGESKPKAVIFDIDGTLAVNTGRNPYDMSKVDQDTVNLFVYELLEFYNNKGYNILLLSGRDESAREKTEFWLRYYEIPYDELFMRKENDYRKDSIIKEEIYNREIKENYAVKAVFDDRLQVLDMWYKNKVYVFNVNQGNKEF